MSNNLYWTESVTGNIEVLDLDTMERAVILNVGANSVVRGVAVDPSTRYITRRMFSLKQRAEHAKSQF